MGLTGGRDPVADPGRPADREARLDGIRREAASTGQVRAAGTTVAGGPLPPMPPGSTGPTARPVGGIPVGYYGRPVLQAPPWTWEVPVYLFVGGLAGGSATLALGARVAGAESSVVSSALLIAVAGVALSAALLVSDLGRPARFLNMLRVFKWRSPMSVGVWLLSAFGAAAGAALLLVRVEGAGATGGALGGAVWIAMGGAALLGALVATYTGVLLAATVVPAWNSHAGALPVHFGAASLGSAAAALELLGHRLDALHLVGLAAALAETALALWLELRRSDPADSALRRGGSGRLVRVASLLTGPAALTMRLTGLRGGAAAAFLLGALLSRFGWLAAGRASTEDPRAAL